MTSNSDSAVPTQTLMLTTALTSARRWAILLYLERHGVAFNSTLVKHLQFSQGEISRHLKILVRAGLVKKEQYALNTVYSLHKQIWLKAKAFIT